MYSTCTSREEENEEVVKKVLKSNDEFMIYPNLFEEWKIRGLEKYEELSKNCIRVYKNESFHTNFFVACFIRKNLIKKRKFMNKNSISKKVNKKIKL